VSSLFDEAEMDVEDPDPWDEVESLVGRPTWEYNVAVPWTPAARQVTIISQQGGGGFSDPFEIDEGTLGIDVNAPEVYLSSAERTQVVEPLHGFAPTIKWFHVKGGPPGLNCRVCIYTRTVQRIGHFFSGTS
jgi:hypothetical protein